MTDGRTDVGRSRDAIASKNAAPELNLGVKINQVYPKIITYYMGLDACLFQKGDIFLYLRVNHGN